MVAPIKLNLKIYQGSTFKQVLRWESQTKVYVPITNITKSAPVVVTAPNHGIVPGWRAKVTNVSGMKEINSTTDYMLVTDVTTDTVTFNQVNSLGYSAYTSGGVLEYNAPINLNGYQARMQIRDKITSDTIIYELATSNQNIIIDTYYNTITLYIPDQDTASMDFTQAVYSLELLGGGEVYAFASGNVVLQREVTR